MNRTEFNEFLKNTREERDVILLNKGREYTQDDIDVLDNFKRNANIKRRKVHQAIKAKLLQLVPEIEKHSTVPLNNLVEELNPVTPLLVWSIYFEKHYDAISSYIYSGDVKSEEKIKTRFYDGENYLELGSALAEENEQLKKVKVTIPFENIFRDESPLIPMTNEKEMHVCEHLESTMEYGKDYNVYNVTEGEAVLKQCVGDFVDVGELGGSLIGSGTLTGYRVEEDFPIIYIYLFNKQTTKWAELNFSKIGYIIQKNPSSVNISIPENTLTEETKNKLLDALNDKTLTQEEFKEKLEEIKDTVMNDKFGGVNKVEEILESKDMTTGNYSTFGEDKEVEEDFLKDKDFKRVYSNAECLDLFKKLEGVSVIVSGCMSSSGILTQRDVEGGMKGIVSGVKEENPFSFTVYLLNNNRNVFQTTLEFVDGNYFTVIWDEKS